MTRFVSRRYRATTLEEGASHLDRGVPSPDKSRTLPLFFEVSPPANVAALRPKPPPRVPSEPKAGRRRAVLPHLPFQPVGRRSYLVIIRTETLANSSAFSAWNRGYYQVVKRAMFAFVAMLGLGSVAHGQLPVLNSIAKGVYVAIDRNGVDPVRVARLRQQLAVGPAKQRLDAMNGLIVLGDFELYSTLVSMFTDRDESVRLPAACAVRDLFTRELIFRYSSFRNDVEKRKAVETARDVFPRDILSLVYREPELVCRLLNGIQDDKTVKSILEGLLGRDWTIGEPEETPTQQELDYLPTRCGTYDHSPECIRRIISNERPDLYLDYAEKAAGWARVMLVEDYQGPWSPRAQRVFSAMAANPADFATRAAIEQLGGHSDPECIRTLNTRKHDRWASNRLSVFYALSSSLPSERWALATEMICDRSIGLRMAIAEEFRLCDDPRTMRWVRREITSSQPYHAQAAIDILVAANRRECFEVLADYTLRPNSPYRLYAAEVLRYADDPVVTNLYSKLIFDADPKVLAVSCKRLGSQGDASDILRLKQLVNHRDKTVCEAAKDAIDWILDRAKEESGK